MTTPLVSVVMLTYDRPQWISRAIQSVVDQTYQNWELIIVDDGPDDRTAAVVHRWELSHDRIQYFHRKKKGNIAEATNFGLARAGGEYIAILDDDDYWATPDKLERQVDFLESHRDYVACGGGAIVVDSTGRESMRYLKPHHDDAIKEKALVANPMVHSTGLYRRVAALAVGGYDETLPEFQDWDFWLKIGTAGKLHNFLDYLTFYSMWGGCSSFSKQTRNARAALRIVWKHRTTYSHLPLAFSLTLLYYCYAHLPAPVRRNSAASLSKLKKLTLAAREPAPAMK